jgi:hypothetical protein
LAAHAEMETPLGPTREALTAQAIGAGRNEASAHGGAVLVEDPALGDEIEGVHAATYRLDLDAAYRFVDLRQQETTQPADTRPPLYWRGALQALKAGKLTQLCQRFWFVSPGIADDFLAAWHAAGCSGTPDSVVLP